MQGQRRQALSSPSYGPTGSTEIAQIALPLSQDMMLTGANTNSENAVIWTIWNDVYTNSISITQTLPNIITSVTNSASTVLTTHAQVWGAWNLQMQANAVTSAVTTHIGQTITDGTMSNITAAIWTNWCHAIRTADPQQVIEAQRQAQQERERQVQAQVVAQVEKSLAEKRAEKLLQEVLTPKQREELAAHRFFTLETLAASGERRIYRIHRGRSRNVEQIDESGRRIKMLCAHPVAPVPDADTMLAQLLMLGSEEEEFLKIANHS